MVEQTKTTVKPGSIDAGTWYPSVPRRLPIVL